MAKQSNTKLIPLTQGMFAVVDEEDFDRISKYKWYAKKDGNTFYATRNMAVGAAKTQ